MQQVLKVSLIVFRFILKNSPIAIVLRFEAIFCKNTIFIEYVFKIEGFTPVVSHV